MLFCRATINMSTSINEVLAFHEAGHAVVAMELGIRILSIGIRPEEGNGYCRDALPIRSLTADMMCAADWIWTRKKALILMGGAAAERVYYLEECSLPFCSQHDDGELDELCCS